MQKGGGGRPAARLLRAAAPLLVALLCLCGCGAAPDAGTAAGGPAAPEATLAPTPVPTPEIVDIEVGTMRVPSDARALDLTKTGLADKKEIQALLSRFPDLESVDLHGLGLTAGDLSALMADYPAVTFAFSLPLYGTETEADIETLVLDGVPVEDGLDAMYAAVPCLKNLTRVDMCGCGPDNAAMAALSDAFPEVRFVWEVYIRDWVIRTDATRFATWAAKEVDGYIVSAKNIGGNTSETLSPLQYCTDLVALDLGHNAITDLSFLSGLTKLKYLILAINEITDIAPLANLKELKYLELFMNEIKDISPLGELENLEALCICNTQVADVSALYGNQKLRRLYLEGYRFKKEAREEIAAALPACEVLYKRIHSSGSDWRRSDYYWEMREALGWKIER